MQRWILAGFEANLVECSLVIFPNYKLTPYKVSYKEGDLCIIGPSLTLEIFQANVVCRQLGFPYGAIGAPCCSPFGQVPNYPNQFSFSYSDVGCSGTEPGLNSCPHLSNSIICSINEAAGVICNTTSEIKYLWTYLQFQINHLSPF